MSLSLKKTDILVLALLVLVASQQIHGAWDAWAMWNTKAEFLASGEWHRIFSPHLAWMHPDYPLLLPMIVAVGWIVVGSQTPWVPLIIAILSSWALYLLVKKWVGIWPALLMISLPAFLRWSGSQYADIPLAMFLLFGTYLLYKQKFLLSGIVFGLAIFTKNEGLMYFILIIVSFVFVFRQWKSIVPLTLGALPGIVPFFMVKHFAPRNEFFAHLPSLSFEHVVLVLKGFAQEFLMWKEWGLFWIIAILLLVFLRKDTPNFWSRFFSVFISLCLISFFVIYLTTPQDVAWHIQTSFNRLLIQILPIVIVAIFIRIRQINTPDTRPDRRPGTPRESRDF